MLIYNMHGGHKFPNSIGNLTAPLPERFERPSYNSIIVVVNSRHIITVIHIDMNGMNALDYKSSCDILITINL